MSSRGPGEPAGGGEPRPLAPLWARLVLEAAIAGPLTLAIGQADDPARRLGILALAALALGAVLEAARPRVRLRNAAAVAAAIAAPLVVPLAREGPPYALAFVPLSIFFAGIALRALDGPTRPGKRLDELLAAGGLGFMIFAFGGGPVALVLLKAGRVAVDVRLQDQLLVAGLTAFAAQAIDLGAWLRRRRRPPATPPPPPPTA